MARAKRVDNKGRVLRVGESQNKDGRYCYKWTDSNGKRSTVYALTLANISLQFSGADSGYTIVA